jgi:hypothetical protein
VLSITKRVLEITWFQNRQFMIPRQEDETNSALYCESQAYMAGAFDLFTFSKEYYQTGG